MGFLLQVLLSGLAAGAVIGLVGLGFSLVAGTVRVLHLAHGDVVVVAVFAGVLGVLGRTPVATGLGPLPALAFVALVLAAGGALSVAVALVAVRPHAGDPAVGRAGDALGWVAGGVAAGLLLREGAGVVFSQDAYTVPDPLRLDRLTASGLLHLPGGAVLPARVPAVLAVAVVLALVAERLCVRGRFGMALRAVADDPDAAALCGVPARRVLLLSFLVAGLLAGAAGLLAAPGRPVGVEDGVVLGLEGAAAALLAGLGSLRGVLPAGLAVGVLQAAAVGYGRPALVDVAPLALLVVVLAVRPEGLRR